MTDRLNSTQTLSAQARGRVLRTAKILVEDSSLRDDLNDAQAQQLLDWAMARLADEATRADSLSDADAGQVLEATTETLRQIMRYVNLFMSKPHDAPAGGADGIMEALLRRAAELAGEEPDPARLARAEILGRQRLDIEDDAAFERVMALISVDVSRMPHQEAE